MTRLKNLSSPKIEVGIGTQAPEMKFYPKRENCFDASVMPQNQQKELFAEDLRESLLMIYKEIQSLQPKKEIQQIGHWRGNLFWGQQRQV